MASLVNNAVFTAVSSGTAAFVVSAAVIGYVTPALATPAAVDGKTYRYRAQNATLTEWEEGNAVASLTASNFTRVVTSSSAGGTTTVNFTNPPVVALTIMRDDILQFDDAMSLTAAQKTQARANIAAALKGHLFGLTLSTAGSSATFSVAAGEAADSTAADLMVLAASLAKTTAAWSVGAAGGTFDGAGTGPSANASWFHVYLIKRPDTGAVDVCTSLSASAPTFGVNIPAAYTLFRRIGSMKSNGSFQWTKFAQVGDEFLLDVNVQEFNATPGATTATTQTITGVPTGVVVTAMFHAFLQAGTTGLNGVLFTALDESDVAVFNLGANGSLVAAVNTIIGSDQRVRTNTSAQIRWRIFLITGAPALAIYTYGWIDTRGRIA